jgi:hypothetical protein
MSARRNISQRTAPPQMMQNNGRGVNQRESVQEATLDIKKMHPLAVLTLHEDRLNEIDEKITQLLNTPAASSQPSKKSLGDESSMLAECIKQIKFLTQENLTNRNLARELTLELLSFKRSLQENTHISEESLDKFAEFKEKANATQSQSVRDELMSGDTIAFNGNGGYDPNVL